MLRMGTEIVDIELELESMCNADKLVHDCTQVGKEYLRTKMQGQKMKMTKYNMVEQLDTMLLALHRYTK